MEQEFEGPELQPERSLSSEGIPLPGPGERVPMPAGPGTVRRSRGGSRFGLTAAAILTAGLAAAMVFRGDLHHADPAAAQPAAVQVIVKAPAPKAQLPTPLSPAPVPRVQPPSELSSLDTPGSPVETAAPEPHGSSSPLPFFSSVEDPDIPRPSALQPYGQSSSPAARPAAARPVLPAADRLIPRLQPVGQGPAAAAAAVPRGLTVDASGACTSCKSAVAGTRTSDALQGGKAFVQHEVSTVYTGVCEGKYVYEYTNLTSNKTIGMKVVTSGGEAWTFTLKPGEKTSLKSSTEFSGGNFENIRTSEVIN